MREDRRGVGGGWGVCLWACKKKPNILDVMKFEHDFREANVDTTQLDEKEAQRSKIEQYGP